MELVPPRDPIANIVYRKDLRKWAMQSARNRQWLTDRCREDFFFWCESFFWLVEPRPEAGISPIRPFVLWPHQMPAAQQILDLFGLQDLGIEKGRGEGGSYLCLAIYIWKWIYHEMQHMLIVSRNELAADNPGNLGSLGGKIDWEMTKLPTWMIGEKEIRGGGGQWSRNLSKHTWNRRDNGSAIVALPTTADLASGERYTAILLDEFAKVDRGDDDKVLASTEPVTNCRILLSTYWGADGAFYHALNSTDTSLVKIVLRWEDNPTRNQDMFRIDYKNSRLLAIDSDEVILAGPYTEEFFGDTFRKLQHRGYSVESPSKQWSPWYVSRCLKAGMTPRTVAMEYDRDPAGSGTSFFSPELIQVLMARTRQPDICGEVDYDLDNLVLDQFVRSSSGRLRLWFPLYDSNPRPPAANYVLGVDIASGTGAHRASNSVISIADRDVGKKVAEFASPTTSPEKLAELAIALCKWFANPLGEPGFLIWESNGYGGAFRERVIASTFRNFFWKPVQWKSTRKKPTKTPGWESTRDSKRDLLAKYRWALQEGFFDNPSEHALKECLSYAEGPGGKVIFTKAAKDADDPSNAGERHGDRVIADALASYAIEYFGGGSVMTAQTAAAKQSLRPPANSFAARQRDRRVADSRRSEW